MTNITSPSLMSQAYFDELCIENYELFDEENFESAVDETVLQLKGSDLKHISLTYPSTEQGQIIREAISRFTSALDSLKSNECFLESVGVLRQSLESSTQQQGEGSSNILLYLFVAEHGFHTLGNAITHLQQTVGDTNGETVDEILGVLDAFPLEIDKRFRFSFQEAIPSSFLTSWLCYFEESSQSHRRLLLLSLAHKSVQRRESNKRLWMQQKQWHKSIIDCLSSNVNDTDQPDHFQFIACRLITTICTFDDFTDDSSDMHQYVQSFARAGAISALEILLQKSPHSSVVMALRALAVQDEVVQSMGSVVETAKNLFLTLHETEASQGELSTALIGFFRNVSANDGFKKQLGSDTMLLDAMQSSMQEYSDIPQLQEHALAWVGALALRQPDNAYRLGSSSLLITLIVSAMKRFAERSTLQRQGALAIRNIASRITDDTLRQSIQGDVEYVLRNVAAKHLSCQDEVYAALRDLGLEVTSVHVEQTGDSLRVREGPVMFGQGKDSNFRAEYDD